MLLINDTALKKGVMKIAFSFQMKASDHNSFSPRKFSHANDL